LTCGAIANGSDPASCDGVHCSYSLLEAQEIALPLTERVMNSFGNSVNTAAVNVARVARDSGWGIVGILLVLAALVIVAYMVWGVPVACPAELHRHADGRLTLKPSGQEFPDMNAFQQWWGSSGNVSICPLPILTGARAGEFEASVTPVLNEWASTSAQTPIYKADDYEFSRVFGVEKDGRMVEPRDGYNMLLGQRQFDWADRPLTSEARRDAYAGLREGFTAAGELTSQDIATREAAARYGEKSHRRPSGGGGDDKDVDCHVSREAKEVASMIAKAYENDPEWEPVVTRVGPHHWEVNELKPRRRHGATAPTVVEERIVDTKNDAVEIDYKYGTPADPAAIDPFYISAGNLPFETERQQRDPFYGPVPGLERMFPPTFDHVKWA
jgi:hypothetical protein